MRKYLLIVDDFNTNLFTLKISLKDKGYNIIKSKCENAALSCCNDGALNLKTSDYKLPGKNNLGSIEMVRSRTGYCNRPLLIRLTEFITVLKLEIKKGIVVEKKQLKKIN